MKFLVMLLISLIPLTSIAGEDFSGYYKFYLQKGTPANPEDAKNSLIQIVRMDYRTYRVRFLGSIYTDDARSYRFRFDCNPQGVCDAADAPWTYMYMLLWSGNGTVEIMTPNQDLKFRRVDDSDNGSLPKNSWSVEETRDNTGRRIVTASTNDSKSGATLVLSCNPDGQRKSWSIHLPDKTYLAAQGAVIVGKGVLKTNGTVNSVSYTNDQWILAANNYIASTSTPSKSFLNDLQNGNTFHLQLVAKKIDGQNATLETMNFRLNGSATAIRQLTTRCSNTLSDLPQIAP